MNPTRVANPMNIDPYEASGVANNTSSFGDGGTIASEGLV